MTLRPLRLFLFTGLTACVLGAAACGGDDDDDIVPGTSSGSVDGGRTSSGTPGASSSGTPGTSSSSGDAAVALRDIVDTAVGAGNFTLLAQALTRAGLIDTLKGPGPFTVLAPSDAAFAASGITAEIIDTIPPATLAGILTYHVIGARVDSAAVGALTNAETLAASGIGEGKLRVRIAAGSDEIRIFPTVDLSNPATTAEGAPAADPGAEVVTPNIQATNGIIHVLDRVLTPPSNNIVQAAQKYTLLDTLVTTLVSNPGGAGQTSLVETLSTVGPFSVFAPTNAAFTAATATIATLEPGEVRTALLYHVVPSFATSGDVVAATADTALPTAAGAGLTLGINPGNPPTIRDETAVAGNLVATDIVTRNGIVHVIDKVLIPFAPVL